MEWDRKDDDVTKQQLEIIEMWDKVKQSSAE